jgi:membrane-associated phospholipid phosphatase
MASEWPGLPWVRAAWTVGLVLFAAGGLAMLTGWLRGPDAALDLWIGQRLGTYPGSDGYSPRGDGVGYLSVWGSQYATVPVTIGTVMGLLAFHQWRSAVVVTAVGMLGGWGILLAQDNLTPMAWWWAQHIEGQVVYPSGHLAGATMAWGFAALMPLRAAHRLGQVPPAWATRLLVFAWLGIVALVGIDRLLVRSHILTDLWGGAGLGLALLMAALAIDTAWQRRAEAAAQARAGSG